jgi:signal transduction histidine kinase
MKKLSFVSLLTVSVVLLMAAPASLGTFFLQRELIAEEQKRLQEEWNSGAEKAAQSVQTELRLVASRLRTLGFDSDLQMGNRSILFFNRIYQRLTDFRSDSPAVKALYFFGRDGGLLAASPLDREFNDDGSASRALEAWRRLDAAKGKDLPQKVPTGTGNLEFALIQDVKDIFGETIGSLMLFINVAWMEERGLDVLPDRVHSKLSWSFENPHEGMTIDRNSSELLSSSLQWLPVAGTFLRIEQTSPERMQKLEQSREFFLFLVAIVTLFGLGVGLLLAKLFVLPLQRLKVFASSVGANFQNGEKDSTQNLIFAEFEDFKRTLMNMAAQIQQQIVAQEQHARNEANLKNETMQAKLLALRNQMNPHFLFNSLNSIQSMIDIEPLEASNMLQTLSDLYRETLLAMDTVCVTFEQEERLILKYLSIQKHRFGSRLSYEVSTHGLKGDTIWVPALLLHTLVENAIKHGLEPFPEGCHIQIELKKAPEEGFFCSVWNHRKGEKFQSYGEKFPLKENSENPKEAFSEKGTGTGLENSRKRLELMYAKKAQLDVQLSQFGSAKITFWISGERIL